MKTTIILAIILICNCKLATADDSIPTQLLKEVVVLADNQWIENGVINCIPTKTEKKLSNSPASLIRSMHLPFVKEKNGTIVNLSGEVVQVFINGEKADDVDLATFWPNEVKRIQYLENPLDPKYEGAKIAINFIMSKYIVGGVSRVNLYQKIPNNGYYTASSKLVYKKMTYGFLFSGNYYRDHRSSMKGETTYKDIFYDNVKYELIEREEDNNSINREDGVRCAFNAKYVNEKSRITHTVSFGWNRNPGSGSNSLDSWHPNLFDSYGCLSSLNANSWSPQVMGSYYFKLTDKWYFSGMWKYSFSRNNSNSINQIRSTNPIRNSTDENVHTFKVAILPSYFLSNKCIFQFRSDFEMDWFSTIYKGSTHVMQDQARQSILSEFRFNWNPNKYVSFSVDPGVATSLWKIGDIKEYSIYPTISTTVNWNPTRKISLNGALQFFMRPTSAIESNPVLVQKSELLWVLGNPHVKNMTSWDAYFQSVYLPKDWFSLSFGFGYVKTFNDVISTYSPASAEMGGLIKETINARPSDNIRANLELRGFFLDDRFSIGISPQWYHTYVRGIYRTKFDCFVLSGNADYTLGNFRLGVSYEGPYRDVSLSGMERSWKQDSWSVALNYGINNLYMELKIQDIFHNHHKSWIRYNSPYFNSRYNYLETGRAISVNLTYSFGYGKKVDNSIDIIGPESTKTSVYQ